MFFFILLTFSFSGCHKKTVVFFQPSLQEKFSRTENKLELDSAIISRNNVTETVTDSVNVTHVVVNDKYPTKNMLEASLSKTLHIDIATKIQEKSILGKLIRKDGPKPKFLGKFREKLKNWHPFKRKHKFTRKLWIGLILLGIAICLELFVHVQILTIIFGIAALFYIIRGLKRLL